MMFTDDPDSVIDFDCPRSNWPTAAFSRARWNTFWPALGDYHVGVRHGGEVSRVLHFPSRDFYTRIVRTWNLEGLGYKVADDEKKERRAKKKAIKRECRAAHMERDAACKAQQRRLKRG